MKDKLLTSFNALSKDEQAIMLILSVIYAPIAQPNLQGLLKALPCFDVKKLATVGNPLRDKLIKNQLIIFNQDGCDATMKLPSI